MSIQVDKVKIQTEEELAELCRLLTTLSPIELQELKERLNNPNLRAVEISEVIADAIRISSNKGDKLGNTLSPLVKDAVSSTIKKNPQELSSALAPVMGPAIRASILNALREYTGSMDRMIQHSVSTKGIGWRLEALRTGKSFAEVVLYHTLEYRVEHVFLINKEDGLLISHLSNTDASSSAPDAVSGMLTAIYDFVNDSFKVGSEDRELGQMRIGDLSVLVCKSEHALLSAVVRGGIPNGFRDQLNQTLEGFELQFRDELDADELDTSKFASFDDRLDDLLQMKLKHSLEKESPKSKWLKMSLIALASFFLLRYFFISFLENRTWNTFLNYLNDKPGLVITSVDKKGSYYNVKGLRDPLAVDPEKLYQRQDFYGKGLVSFNFKSFQSLEHEIVRQRVVKKFSPPEEVLFDVNSQGVLTVSGVGSKDWVENFNSLAQEIVGVNKVDSSNLKVSSVGRYQEIQDVLQKQSFAFSITENFEQGLFEEENKKTLDRIASLIAEFYELAETEDGKTKINIKVHFPKEVSSDKPSSRLFSFRNKVYSELISRRVPSSYLDLSNQFYQREACDRFPKFCKNEEPFLYFHVNKLP